MAIGLLRAGAVLGDDSKSDESSATGECEGESPGSIGNLSVSYCRMTQPSWGIRPLTCLIKLANQRDSSGQVGSSEG